MQMLEIRCPRCGTVNEFRSDALRPIAGCKSCGDLIYEIDEESSKVRITKRFRDYYRELKGLWPILHKEVAGIRIKEQKGESIDSALDSIEAIVARALEICSHMANENGLSDDETRASTSDFLPVLESYLNSLSGFRNELKSASAPDEAANVASKYRDSAKDASVFFHLMDMYLGERQPG